MLLLEKKHGIVLLDWREDIYPLRTINSVKVQRYIIDFCLSIKDTNTLSAIQRKNKALMSLTSGRQLAVCMRHT